MSQDNLKPLCRFLFFQGSCRSGDACKFSHSLEPEHFDPSLPPEAMQHAYVNVCDALEAGKKLCSFHFQGRCTNNSCRMAHALQATDLMSKFRGVLPAKAAASSPSSSPSTEMILAPSAEIVESSSSSSPGILSRFFGKGEKKELVALQDQVKTLQIQLKKKEKEENERALLKPLQDELAAMKLQMEKEKEKEKHRRDLDQRDQRIYDKIALEERFKELQRKSEEEKRDAAIKLDKFKAKMSMNEMQEAHKREISDLKHEQAVIDLKRTQEIADAKSKADLAALAASEAKNRPVWWGSRWGPWNGSYVCRHGYTKPSHSGGCDYWCH